MSPGRSVSVDRSYTRAPAGTVALGPTDTIRVPRTTTVAFGIVRPVPSSTRAARMTVTLSCPPAMALVPRHSHATARTRRETMNGYGLESPIISRWAPKLQAGGWPLPVDRAGYVPMPADSQL